LGAKPGERIVTGKILEDMKQYFIIKMPKALDDIKEIQKLEKEYQVIMAAGEHLNLIRKEEYHTEPNIVYMALDFPVAKSLYHYLTKTREIDGEVNYVTRNNERWTRYLFRQFIAGLQKIHEAGIAHLDINIDNVLVDIVEIDGMREPRIKIANFGMSQIDLHNVNADHG
jgi:serine/threonine protein kinase